MRLQVIPLHTQLQALAGATNGPFVAVFLTGAIGSVLANIINNQVRKTVFPTCIDRAAHCDMNVCVPALQRPCCNVVPCSESIDCASLCVCCCSP